ncbi:MAG: organomercurial lyase [Candidatus Eremiobacteraeota bacterium]|nr:organomercurial lyase [Candidatus Eremiobacteraeota bacterium]
MPRNIDLRVRSEVYDKVLERGFIPSSKQLAVSLGVAISEVKSALQRLSHEHVLVLQPESGEVLMAMPFSAVPTSFIVRDGNFSWYANCSWDAFGIGAMLGRASVIHTACGCCGEGLLVNNPPESIETDTRVVHFAVPVAQWWDDVVFT